MAPRTAAGYNNLPNGNFSATIFSKKVQQAFRETTTVGAITNSDYAGEIGKMGDTVTIIKEPDIEVFEYVRGGGIKVQDLEDEAFTLKIDTARAFAFSIDDLEEAFSYVDWEAMATDRAGFQLTNTHDKDILGRMMGYRWDLRNKQFVPVTEVNGSKAVSEAGDDELLASMKLRKDSFGWITTASAGDHSIPVAPRMPGATTRSAETVTPNDVVKRMARLLNQQNVPSEGRFLVVDPVFMEMLADEDSRFLNSDFGESGGLRNGLRLKRWQGFEVYESNNLVQVGTGPGTSGVANQNENYGLIIAGIKGAVATAEVLRKTEKDRIRDGFGDLVKGLHLYGSKVLRPEGLVSAKYNAA